MHAFQIRRSLVLALVAITPLVGCSKTNLTNMWRDPDASTAPMDNLLVVVLERDMELRRAWEDALCAEFQAYGVHARPSHQLWPSLPDSSQVPVVMRRDGNDGAIVTHRLSVTQTGPSGGYDKTTPATGNDYWRSWYFTHYTAANAYGVVHKEKEARFQIDLVSVRGGGRMVWTGSTTPIDPLDAEKVRSEVAGQLVPELRRRDLLVKSD